MNKFILVHTYNNLVDDDKARPLVCRHCSDPQSELIPMIDAEKNTDEPVMWCPRCDTRFHFGTDTWGQIESIVMEHHDI